MRKFWLLLALAAASVAVGGFVSAEQGSISSASDTSVSKWKGNACVEPTPVMRREHMDFLLGQRDETMRQGIRTGPYSLKACVECHVQKDKQGRMIPVNASKQFCQKCHQYTAVSIDCFECHAAILSTEE
uniref:Uncharacterized protein n=1 Tax=Candidatus Kentrum eta TaxID=2126337 RepID=A0A450UH30_9GAMM|nr:MAG: hypothetical protein BECKH772A_GA0070896_1003511 [Candidatus Kentron sp. H]VFJ92877.1 MAG: hypothetical protein BECKH772B_GA0070898_1003511 [Candidatus Kentron sp. H]VFJ99701.1 MAG: hypothetical protein BECKH772C_GA0070978_1003411 [Candidatus Kentron sp. H]